MSNSMLEFENICEIIILIIILMLKATLKILHLRREKKCYKYLHPLSEYLETGISICIHICGFSCTVIHTCICICRASHTGIHVRIHIHGHGNFDIWSSSKFKEFLTDRCVISQWLSTSLVLLLQLHQHWGCPMIVIC